MENYGNPSVPRNLGGETQMADRPVQIALEVDTVDVVLASESNVDADNVSHPGSERLKGLEDFEGKSALDTFTLDQTENDDTHDHNDVFDDDNGPFAENVRTPNSQFAEADCKTTWRKAARSVPVGEAPRLSSGATNKIKDHMGKEGPEEEGALYGFLPNNVDAEQCRNAGLRYFPFLTWFPELLKNDERCSIFQADAIAGMCVGIMAIPQSMSYANIAGLPYIYGLYAMLISTAIYAFFGTSKQMAIGPTAIMSIIVYDGLASVLTEENCPAMAEFPDAKPSELCPDEYVSAALVCSFWVGVINLVAGFLNLGILVNFLAHPVVAGFTSGAGIIIGLSQMKYIVGTDVKKSKIIYETLYNIFSVFDDWNWNVIAFGVAWIVMLGTFKWIAQNYPQYKLIKSCGPLIVSILGIIVMVAFPDLEDDKGIEIVGDIPEGFPEFTLPTLDFSYTNKVLGGAISASVIGFLESIAIAKSIAAQHPGDEVIADNEMVALGVTNFIGSMFSAYPVTGSFSRSAVNNSSGARSQIAGLWTCFIIAMTLIVLTPIIYYLPKFALAAIVINSVRGLVSFDEFFHLWKVKKNDAIIWALAFLGTLFLGITYGIGLAVIISVAIVLRRTMRAQLTVLWRLPHTHVFADIKLTTSGIFTPGVLCTRVGNMMYFANCGAIKDELKSLITQYSQYDPVQFVVISLSPVYSVDASAIHLLEAMIKDIHEDGIDVVFACVNPRVMEAFKRSHICELVGDHGFHETEFDACHDCSAQIVIEANPIKRRASMSMTHISLTQEYPNETLFEPFHSHY